MENMTVTRRKKLDTFVHVVDCCFDGYSPSCCFGGGATDTGRNSVPMTISCEENAVEEKQVVNEVVVFIRFADESEDIYAVDRGGYDSILEMFNGDGISMKTYID